jgi:type VI secretion system secreted protein Hcp
MKGKGAAIALILALLCVLKITTAQMMPPSINSVRTGFVVKIVSQRQGPFKAEAPHGGIDGIRFSSQLNSPRDVATGLPSGKRQYSPIMFTKNWGPASPQIIAALTTNENLSTVTFEFYKTAADGKQFIYQTIVLTNATVSSVRRYIDVPSGGEPPDSRALEDVSLTFQKIELKDASGTAAMDDWNAVR